MAKQYTFKTTKDTEWMEEHLDKLHETRELSSVLRGLVSVYLDNVRPAVRQKSYQKTDVTHRVTPIERVREAPPYEPAPKNLVELGNYDISQQGKFIALTEKNPATEWEPHPTDIEEPTFEAIDEDLDSKLDNLDF